MRKRGAIAVVFFAALSAAAGPVYADSFRDRLRQAAQLLRDGDAAGALAIYRDLQIDDPKSGRVQFGAGCAQYELALNQMALEAPDEAATLLEEARNAFQAAASSSDATLQRDGAYNLVNTKAQQAKLMTSSQDYQGAIAAFKEAVKGYEDYLRRYPQHEAARQNLDHMRYYLKKMLQNPPQQQEQQQQQDQQNQQQDQQNQQQQNQDQGQGQQAEEQQQNQDSSQSQPQNSGEQEQNQQDQQQQAERKEPQEDKEDSDEPIESVAQLSEQDNPGQSEEDAKPNSRENIEAILQNLEDMDNREQRDMRQPRQASRPVREWW